MNFISDVSNSMLSEFILFITIFILSVISMFYNLKFHKLSKWIALIGVSFSLFSLKFLQLEPIFYAFKESVISDTFTVFIKAVILITAFIIILLSKKNVTKRNHKTFQFYTLLLSAVLSSLFVVSANDFLTLTVSLEMLSFCTYFLIAYKKGYLSKEASFKYIVTNSFATATYLFGVSYLYGITSSLNFGTINDYFLQHEPTVFYTISILLISVGLLFKLAILPFSNWILDVYEGSATSVSAFISTIPKIAVLAIFARLLVFIFGYSFVLPLILIFLSVITAVWANALAIRQRNILRLLACSSSANVSYMLFALSLVSVYNLSTVLFYLLTYIFMNLGAFSAVIILENSNYSSKLYEFKGFAYSNPLFTLAFAVCMFGLAGFPITSGFIAKLYFFSAIIRSGAIFIPPLIIMALTMAIACYYYTKVVKLMFERNGISENEILPHRASSPTVILYACAAITVLVGIVPVGLIEVCKFIAYNL
ncbi:NADH-quinone oxidoreductase subunit N [bacterium]|nr:NADH-quinone oxidoreductase subunit N [bacterium]